MNFKIAFLVCEIIQTEIPAGIGATCGPTLEGTIPEMLYSMFSDFCFSNQNYRQLMKKIAFDLVKHYIIIGDT